MRGEIFVRFSVLSSKYRSDRTNLETNLVRLPSALCNIKPNQKDNNKLDGIYFNGTVCFQNNPMDLFYEDFPSVVTKNLR